MNMSTNDDNLKSGAAPYLEADEHPIATLIASVRGHQQSAVGGIAGAVGGSRAAKAVRSAADADIQLASPMGLVLTPTRLLTLRTGGRGVPKELLNAFPLDVVGSMQVKRLGLGASVTLNVGGVEVRLESRVGAARAFAAELDRVKSDALR
jgi:hypothetical protein